MEPVLAFLASPNFRELLDAQPEWKEAKKGCAFVSFKIDGYPQPVFQSKDVKEFVQGTLTAKQNSEECKFCLVSGRKDFIAELHPAIKGVLNTNTTGGNIVSFNFQSVCSFEKKQGDNAPIGQQAAFEYTTALNTLLSKDSHQKMLLGDATTVFWSSKPSELEDEFADIFSEPEKDNPDKGVKAVEHLLSSVRTGTFLHNSDETRFYVLGLSPNSARISVRFWHVGTVSDMERRFADWFENLRIVHFPTEKEHLSLWRLLVSLAPLGKSENIPPNLAGAVMRSILDGTAYPATLLTSALLRTKAEQDVNYPRAKIIKAFLNHNQKRNLTMSLDKNNTDIGYCLGRLFSILEKIQLATNPGINATIRDKFYASASATPSAVFGNLIRLSMHHLSKLDSDKKGLRIWLESQLEDIMLNIVKFPSHLSLEEQGMFAIGYYHQKMARKDDATIDNSSPESK